jgi:hypothetical protein
MDDGFRRPDDVVAKEREAEDVEKATGRQDAKDEITRVSTTASEPELPFSKARTIALVATIAAAPFLSVGDHQNIRAKATQS